MTVYANQCEKCGSHDTYEEWTGCDEVAQMMGFSCEDCEHFTKVAPDYTQKRRERLAAKADELVELVRNL